MNKVKFSQRSVWKVGDWQFQYNWRYLGKVNLEAATAALLQYSTIPATSYVDAAVDCNVTRNLKLRLALTNPFDKQPPIAG